MTIAAVNTSLFSVVTSSGDSRRLPISSLCRPATLRPAICSLTPKATISYSNNGVPTSRNGSSLSNRRADNEVLSWKSSSIAVAEGQHRTSFVSKNNLAYGAYADSRCQLWLKPVIRLRKHRFFLLGQYSSNQELKKCGASFSSISEASDRFKRYVSVFMVHLVVGVVLLVSITVPVAKNSSWALSEENLLFLEAWRMIDRAYIDKTFNGQSWFRYRENALRNEPMNNREETYAAIRKMLATLDDPFTRFLEPEKFRSLQSGSQGSLTGVGLSIGYPTGVDRSSTGLVVISAGPGGPANRAGILSGDLILAIDDASTENMNIYDAAERLQGPEGSLVTLTIRSGDQLKHMVLRRERVSLNPVKSKVCEIPGSGKDDPRIGYIKLTAFSQNSSGAVKDAIETLRSKNVNAFVLDLRDNSGGLFPEGIEIAKIWLDKGVIVYICDSRGVRDVYDIDGSDIMAAPEPLVVLVNKGTASASEILAGALKDNKRAVLFGEPTYGKGKIQSVFQLSDGSGLAVTVARYETPAHIDIDRVGIIPDHPLPVSFPKDVNEFCSCLQDPSSSCYLNRVKMFAR